MTANEPVSGEESEGQPGHWILRTRTWQESLQKNQAIKDYEVERPDAEHSTYVESAWMDPSNAIQLPGQQLCDEKRAKQKEDGNTEIAEKTEVVKPEVPSRIDGKEVHSMYKEYDKERQKSEHVELRAIETIGSHWSQDLPFRSA